MKIFERHPELLPVFHGATTFDFTKCYSRTNPEGAMAEEDVAAALIVAEGHYADAARILGRSRQSLFNYVLRNQDLFELREEIFESALDEIERGYIQDAKQGDGTARKFFLTTRAKNRGYTTRVEHTGKDDGPIEHTAVDPIESARRAAFTMELALRRAAKGEDASHSLQSGDSEAN